MSAPTTINVAQLASMTSSSPSLYVPIHKRAGSNASSSSSSGSGRSSPSSTSSSSYDALSPSVYSVATLLSLQPLADESMKGKLRVTCPEVVMTRKMRKALEYNGRRTEILTAQQLPMQASVAFVDISATQTDATSTPQAAPLRVTTRRSRPTGRASERRRNIFSSQGQAGLKFGSRRGLSTGDDSWRLQAMAISPVLLV
ncbi:hypothetical protein BYT27DRAFT_7240039 [Phlegmacium glaucopus]|nr:hypothetical protein BYT27DRAFT_7240039 [Phlegmacium glaucopus]